MATILRALALAGLLCLASAARNLALVKVTRDESREFDYFMFVRQWAGSYCSDHSCPLVHDRSFHFTIHGLWPNYDDGTWPQFCNKDYKFDESQLDDIMDALEDEWPSVMDSDETFWEHEWSKHGTCALNTFSTEHSFFKHILKLHWRYDLAAALRAADIYPSNSRVYDKKDIVDAIERQYGTRALVHCTGKELSEIWMCLDKDLRPFDCDTSHERGGCEDVIIPPFRKDLAAA